VSRRIPKLGWTIHRRPTPTDRAPVDALVEEAAVALDQPQHEVPHVCVDVNVPHRMLGRIVAWVFGLVAILWALDTLQVVISWVLLAAFLAIAIDRPVRRMQEHGFPRSVAIAAVFAVVVAILSMIAWALFPPLLQQADGLVRDLPGYVAQVQDSDRYEQLDERFGIGEQLDERLVDVTSTAARLLPAVARALVNGIFATTMVLILTLLMLAHGRRLVHYTLELLEPRSRRRWQPFFSGAYTSIAGFVSGTIAVASISGAYALVLLLLLDVPQPLPLVAWLSLWALIPIIGAPIGSIPAIAVAWFDEPWKAGAIVLAIIVYQQFESAYISPTVLGRSVRVSPLLVLISVLAGAQLAGLLGAILAVPVAGTIQIVSTEWARVRRASVAVDA
jgi:putative heme transporter